MRPRVHGNGFIQLALTDRIRLHVWFKRSLLKQVVYTGIHNHRFRFRSTVLRGEIIHRELDFHHHWDGPYRLYKPRPDETLEATARVGFFTVKRETVLRAGDEYVFLEGKFHETVPVADLSVTLMEKTDVFDIPVMVACPADGEPDNEFDRDAHDENDLWMMITKALRGGQ